MPWALQVSRSRVNRMGLGNTVRAKAGRSPMADKCRHAWHAVSQLGWLSLREREHSDMCFIRATRHALCVPHLENQISVLYVFAFLSLPIPPLVAFWVNFSKMWSISPNIDEICPLSGSFRFFPARCLRSRTWRGMEPSLSRTLQRKKSSDFSFNLNSISVYARSSSL